MVAADQDRIDPRPRTSVSSHWLVEIQFEVVAVPAKNRSYKENETEGRGSLDRIVEIMRGL